MKISRPHPRFLVLGLAIASGLLTTTSLRAESELAAVNPSTPATPVAAPSRGAITRNRVLSLLPGDRKALVLKTTERNPFARRNPDVDLITDDTNQETEADLIRDILNNLPITGRSYGPKGLRVLAGGIVFEKGELVDHVIENQSENLIVEQVNETNIELAWIDTETSRLTGKRLILPYDLSPKVRFVLKGPQGSDGEAASLKFGVIGRRPDGQAMAGQAEQPNDPATGIAGQIPAEEDAPAIAPPPGTSLKTPDQGRQ